jgi:hypothetical protein
VVAQKLCFVWVEEVETLLRRLAELGGIFLACGSKVVCAVAVDIVTCG